MKNISKEPHRKPLVSVVVIFYNAAKFIREAIDSVESQSYDNWEVLLVDDGSTDRSSAIARDYADAHNPKVRYLAHEGRANKGKSASRNLGISHAQGEFIAFLDADDVWLPHKLERQVAIMDSHREAAMVYGPAEIWHSWAANAKDLQRDHQWELGIQPNTLISPPGLLPMLLLGQAAVPSMSDLIVRRTVIEAIGGFEESFRDMYEDQVFIAKVCLRAAVFVAGESWSKYRQHPDSCCSVAMRAGTFYTSRVPYLKWLDAYLAQHGVGDRGVWRALKQELRRYQHPRLHRCVSTALRLLKRSRTRLKSVARRVLPHPAHRT